MFHLHACHIFWHVEYFWTCLEVQLIIITGAICIYIYIYIYISKKKIQRWKYITPMEFAKHLRKSDVSEKSTIYYGQFLWNGLHVERYRQNLSRDIDRIDWAKILLKSALECPFVYYVRPLLTSRLQLVRDTLQK